MLAVLAYLVIRRELRDRGILATSGKLRDRSEWPAGVTAVIRRVVRTRVNDPATREDLVQETIARLLEKGPNLPTEGLARYAAVTARNLVISQARTNDVRSRNSHRLLDPSAPESPDDRVLRTEEREAITTALGRISPADRDAVVDHEIFETDMASLARRLNSTPGGAAVRLARARAKLRVEYLVALRREEPPSESCRRVLTAFSGRDRRRQRALGAGEHVSECEYCARQKLALSDRLA